MTNNEVRLVCKSAYMQVSGECTQYQSHVFLAESRPLGHYKTQCSSITNSKQLLFTTSSPAKLEFVVFLL